MVHFYVGSEIVLFKCLSTMRLRGLVVLGFEREQVVLCPLNRVARFRYWSWARKDYVLYVDVFELGLSIYGTSKA